MHTYVYAYIYMTSIYVDTYWQACGAIRNLSVNNENKGTHFACFTGTKVHILTLEELGGSQNRAGGGSAAADRAAPLAARLYPGAGCCRY